MFDREQLRAAMLHDMDTLLNSWLVKLTKEQRAILIAQRAFWHDDAGDNLDAILAKLPADLTPAPIPGLAPPPTGRGRKK